MKRLTTMLSGACAAMLCAVMAAVLPVQHAAAVALTQVTGFGDNPGNLQMYVYVPDTVQASPPIVMALHPCGGSGPGFYSSSEFASLADRYGFVVIFPSASNKKFNCFDNWSEASKVRGGRTDPVSLMSMIAYAEQRYGGDPDRVFVTGSSSGGMMTNAMAALYPEVFKAGAAFMGVPFTCFPNEGAYQPGGNPSPCVGKTAQQWGGVVRQANPGYHGPWPRMQLWHGTDDNVVSYAELAEEIKQWTNVHGLSTTPTSTDAPRSGWTRQRFADSSGTVPVEAITVSGAGHSLPMTGMAQYAVEFFGIASGDSTPPPQSDSTCQVTYTANTWNNGFTADISITSTTTVNGWTLTWAWPGDQHVTGAWNADVTQSGAQATARNAPYNATIAAGAATSFGLQATYSGTNTAPTEFSLNGTQCTTSQ